MGKIRIITSFCQTVAVIALCTSASIAQELGKCAVSYVTSSVVYVDAGTDRQLAQGDTMIVKRGSEKVGVIVVFAASRLSSAGHILSQRVPIAVGDQAFWKPHSAATSPPVVVDRRDSTSFISSPQTEHPGNAENVLRGMIVGQYERVSADDHRLNLSQPGLTGHLMVDNMLGTGVALSLNAQTRYDATNNYGLYGQRTGIQTRAYEVALRRDQTDSPFGFGLGRITSRYASGLGSFDGGEVYYRIDAFTAGILGGAQVLDRTLSLNQEGTKGGFFLSYRSGLDPFHRYDGTVAYGRQMVNGQLDREFLYTQNQLSLGSDLWIYQSSDIELNNVVNGSRRSSLTLSSMSIQVHCVPVTWLSADGGYDAYRTVPLYETMKLIPDSLLDRGLFQGVHAATSIRLSSDVTLTLNASYGSRPSDGRSSSAVGAGIREVDLFGTEINAGLRGSGSSGPYADAREFVLDLDRQITRDLTLTLRGTYRSMSVSVLLQTYKTMTGGLDAYYRLSNSWFISASSEYISDPTMNSFRIFTEVGFRF